ncbi:MAG: hypothetical protein JHD35_03275 [Sphingopyxis sp.]|nr:hypothetical protein [Sphingopyxis sp.]
MASELTIEWQEHEITSIAATKIHDAEITTDPSYTPVRDLRTRRNARSITGQLNSIHADISHVYESLGEMRHAIICDADWNVLRLETQPQRISLADGRTYTPDAKVWLRGSARPIFRELKPIRWLRDDPDLKGKLHLISESCAMLGCDFEILSDVWYNRQPRLMNSNWIRRAAKHAPDAHLRHVAELLSSRGALPADEIARQSGLGGDGVFAAYALVGLRFCLVDLDRRFDSDTVISAVKP